MSAWEEAEIIEAMAFAMACDAGDTLRGDARAAYAALAPHLAARDAAAFRRGADAQRALMHHLNRHVQRLDEFPLATPEIMEANGLSAGKSPGDALAPPQPQSGGTEP